MDHAVSELPVEPVERRPVGARSNEGVNLSARRAGPISRQRLSDCAPNSFSSRPPRPGFRPLGGSPPDGRPLVPRAVDCTFSGTVVSLSACVLLPMEA